MKYGILGQPPGCNINNKEIADITNKQKVLITGGTGYLGARIGEALSTNDYDVYLGSRHPFSRGTINGCSQVGTDWSDPELTFCQGFDIIFHAAGMNAQDCEQNPDLAFEFNSKITERLARKSALYGCKQFFYLSTVHVYMAHLSGCLSESSTVLNTHPYAASHLLGEQALLSVARDSQMNGHVLRLTNCFGYPATHSSECWGLVLNEFIRDAATNGVIKIQGNHKSRRDFLPISELNKILVRILSTTIPIPTMMNISTGHSRTLEEAALEVSNAVTELTGNSIQIIKENVSGKSYNLSIQNESLKAIGIYPQKTLTNEINRTLAWLKTYV